MKFTIFGLALMLLAACQSQPGPNVSGGPLLLQESTLGATETPLLLPTRILTNTPVPPSEVPPSPQAQATNEILSPLDVSTVESDFVLVTPTLPPSKTPTHTPTVTLTPSITPSPTLTATASATIQAFPTSIIVPVTAVVAAPIPVICDSVWFFTEPRPAGCPLSAPITAQAVYQQFQNGYMVWVASQDAIYVMYNDTQPPRWQVMRDEFEEGMVEEDPAYANGPTDSTWQPRRGFGMLWRNNEAVRNRIGWAIDEWEFAYSATVQPGNDGTLFISTPTGAIFSILPGGTEWTLYAGVRAASTN